MARKARIQRLRGRRVISVGGPFQDAVVSLCVYARRIDIDRLTLDIGCQPSSSQTRGQVTPGRRVPAPIGLWCLDAPPRLRLEAQLKYLLDKTTPRESTWRRIRRAHDVQLRCAVFLRSWTEGGHFSRELVQELGRRRWSLSLTAYSAGGDKIVDGFLRRRRMARTRGRKSNKVVQTAV